MGTADAYEPWSSDGARGSAANEPYELYATVAFKLAHHSRE